jgi:hypothetical protein
VCDKRYVSDPDHLKEIVAALQHMASKKELDEAVKKITNFFLTVVMNSKKVF